MTAKKKKTARAKQTPARAKQADTLSAADARRIALAAQGFATRPDAATLRHVRAVFDDVAVIQVDSVNVLCRSQELPLWARLGPHARDALPTLARGNVVFEYWGHEASLMPVELQPLLRWRMAEARQVAWRFIRKFAGKDPGYIASVRDEVHARGTLIARDLEERTKRKKGPQSWWRWDDRKRALAYLFWAGEISAIRSPDTFERVYTPFDKVVPAEILATATPTPDDARKQLLVHAVRALGLGTARDLADYFRIKMPVARPLIAELVEAGALVATAVDGWNEPAFRDPAAPAPRGFAGRALLSPFDSLIWYRERTERLFDFRYRIEIYTPAHKRVHGYYVLPFLLGEALVARVDLKADRAAGALLVHGAYRERGAPPETAAELAAELSAMAGWLGLERVVIGRRGDLATALRAQLAGTVTGARRRPGRARSAAGRTGRSRRRRTTPSRSRAGRTRRPSACSSTPRSCR